MMMLKTIESKILINFNAGETIEGKCCELSVEIDRLSRHYTIHSDRLLDKLN